MLPEAQKLIEEMAELTQVLAKYDPPEKRYQWRRIVSETEDVEKKLKAFRKEMGKLYPRKKRPSPTKSSSTK